jgi:hypothetical protein
MLPSLYTANWRNTAVTGQEAESTTGLPTRSDKAMFPSANISNLTYIKLDLRLPPRCWWDLRSSGILRGSWPLKMGPTHCPETSVNNYHTTPHNIPEERRLHILFILLLLYLISVKNFSFQHRFCIAYIRGQQRQQIQHPPQNSRRQTGDMKLHTEDPQILGATVQNILARQACKRSSVHAWFTFNLSRISKYSYLHNDFNCWQNHDTKCTCMFMVYLRNKCHGCCFTSRLYNKNCQYLQSVPWRKSPWFPLNKRLAATRAGPEASE